MTRSTLPLLVAVLMATVSLVALGAAGAWDEDANGSDSWETTVEDDDSADDDSAGGVDDDENEATINCEAQGRGGGLVFALAGPLLLLRRSTR